MKATKCSPQTNVHNRWAGWDAMRLAIGKKEPLIIKRFYELTALSMLDYIELLRNRLSVYLASNLFLFVLCCNIFRYAVFTNNDNDNGNNDNNNN